MLEKTRRRKPQRARSRECRTVGVKPDQVHRRCATRARRCRRQSPSGNVMPGAGRAIGSPGTHGLPPNVARPSTARRVRGTEEQGRNRRKRAPVHDPRASGGRRSPLVHPPATGVRFIVLRPRLDGTATALLILSGRSGTSIAISPGAAGVSLAAVTDTGRQVAAPRWTTPLRLSRRFGPAGSRASDKALTCIHDGARKSRSEPRSCAPESGVTAFAPPTAGCRRPVAHRCGVATSVSFKPRLLLAHH